MKVASVTEATILSDAKLRSVSYCSKLASGCEITAHRNNDGSWSASVNPVAVRAADGRRYVGIDSDDMYFYDTHGNFRSALRGYQ